MPLLFLLGLAQHHWPVLPPSVLSLSCRPCVLDEGHRVSSVALPHPSKQRSVLMPTLLSEHHTALHHYWILTTPGGCFYAPFKAKEQIFSG